VMMREQGMGMRFAYSGPVGSVSRACISEGRERGSEWLVISFLSPSGTTE
jgi:hypothetical protein